MNDANEDAEVNNANDSSDESNNDTKKINYKLCCVYNDEYGNCGPFTRDRKYIDNLVYIKDLDSDTESHLRNLLFKDVLESFKWSERDLVENRVGRVLDDSMQICAHHRKILGICWRPSRSCLHPSHEPQKKGKKAGFTKLAPLWLVMKLNAEKPNAFTIGGQICIKHLQEESDKKHPVVREDDDIEDSEVYVPEEVTVSDDVRHISSEISSQLTDLLDISPVRFQISRTPVDRISASTKKTLKRKLHQVNIESMKRFAECVAPGQGDKLLGELLDNESADDEESEIPTDLAPLLEAYKNSDSQGKLIILSLIDSAHTKSEIQRIFGCSKYVVEMARQLKSSTNGVVISSKDKFRRNRINNDKCEHFLSFLFSSGILQDVAYGVTKIKFDSGAKQTIPHAILTTKYSHAILFYKDICKETNYRPLSDSTLWRILRALKPSQRKSLSGLDDITADGMNGFSHLETFLMDAKKDKTLLDKLERGKRYLKISFQSHCSFESHISSHNAAFALSTPQDEPCLDISEEVCADCYNLIAVLEQVQNIAMNEGNDDDKYDVKRSIDCIINYMKHQMRDYQQRRAKSHCFNNLDENTAFWLKDFAQKVLPQRYREGQRSYFGKKGMSLHIDVFFRMENEELLKYVYFTTIFRSKQSMVDVLNLADNVIDEFKKDCPMIKKLYTKSDNAGCYHGNFVLEATHKLCGEKGIELLRYDYNEPCKGKDQCDRESSGTKTVMNSFVNSGKNINDAIDVFNALHYGKGINNAKVCVLEVDLEVSTLQGTEIANISSFHSCKFFPEYMKLYRYFNVGPGKVIPYSDNCKFVPSYERIKEFSRTQDDGSASSTSLTSGKKKKRSDHSLCTLIFCQEPSCSAVFKSVEEYDRHTLSEKHVVPQRESSMDNVRSSFIKKMKASSQLHTTSNITGVDIAETNLSNLLDNSPLMRKIAEQGWALPQRQNFRYSYTQKKPLYDMFMEGERTGKKKSPEEVEMILRKKLNPQEYVTSSQIRSLFSAFAKKLKQGTLKAPEEKRVVDDINDEGEKNEEVVQENADNEDEYPVDLQREVLQVLTDIAEWEVDDYVAILYDEDWYPGQVTQVNDDGSVDVKCMKYVDKFQGTNKFLWSQREDKKQYNKDELLLKLNAPTEVTTGKRLQYYEFSESDFNDAFDILRMVLGTK